MHSCGKHQCVAKNTTWANGSVLVMQRLKEAMNSQLQVNVEITSSHTSNPDVHAVVQQSYVIGETGTVDVNTLVQKRSCIYNMSVKLN